MRILLETKKYSIYASEYPIEIHDSKMLTLQGYLVNNVTDKIIVMYQKWSKNYLTTLENLGKKLYKKAKRIK